MAVNKCNDIALDVGERGNLHEGLKAGMNPLRFSLWGGANANNVGKNSSAMLTWVDLTVEILSWRGESRKVLHGLTGYAEPGQLMAIMGPSGSGKSTMLDALAGRLATNIAQTGTIWLNGHKKKLSYGTAAYVTQEDNLMGTLTVRESIWYSAEARLPVGMAVEEKRSVVEAAMLEMGLMDCADTPVGNWHMRGISGGEKRRLSIAIEILLRPCLLFLDEPTSGLDSAAAFFVTQTLSSLAKGGRTIVASIHQPSSEVFELFDTLFLLASGRTVYFGQANEACNFFAASGFPCPSLRNPSDHYLRCINSDFDKIILSFKSPSGHTSSSDAIPDPFKNHTTTEIISTLLESYRDSEYALSAASKTSEASQRKGDLLHSCGSQARFWKQAATLTKRSFTNMLRDVGYYWLRLVVYVLVSICVGTIYLNVGTTYNAILARASCGAFIFGFVTFMSIGGFPSFVEDMKVFQKERLNGHYGVVSFVIGNSLSSIPFLFVISVISASICYFMVGLHPGFTHYAFFTLNLLFSVMVVEGLMMAIASVVPNFLMGIIIGAGIQGIFMLVAGYFRLPNDIPKPVWKYPVSYLSFDYWALQGQDQNDLSGLMFEDQNGLKVLSGDVLLKQVFQIDTNRSKWWDLSVILAMVLIYRIIFFIFIKLNEDVTPWVRGYFAKKALQRKKASTLHHSGNMSPVKDTISAAPPSP
eukprot:c19788_g1_i1 orf=198-2294(+)